MLANAFPEPEKRIESGDVEELTTFSEVVLYLQSLAETFRYLDDYPILVTEACTESFIIMSIEEFNKLHHKMVGQ